MGNALKFAAAGELTTGLALLAVPSCAASLLLGGELDGGAVPVARVAGIALIGLGVACWPGPASVGMLVYNTAVAAYRGYLGLAGLSTGVLLWPAVALHLTVASLLSFSLMRRPYD